MLSNDKMFNSKPKLLLTEDPAEYEVLWTKLFQEQKPVGIIERYYVDDAARLLWEINRLRNCVTDTVNNSFPRAVKNLLLQLLPAGSIKATSLSNRWLVDLDTRKEVAELLVNGSLHESAIQSEAINVASEKLERLDRMLALARSRLDKTLRLSAEYSTNFAERLRQNANIVLEGGNETQPDLNETLN